MTFSQKVLMRDGYFCRICTMPATEAHHIIHRWNKKIAEYEQNGISLCYKCHREIHNGKIKHEKIKAVMERIYGKEWEQDLIIKSR